MQQPESIWHPTTPNRRWWLVLQRDAEPYGCLRDPLLDETRYIHVQAAIPTLLALARGRCDWSDALGDGMVVSGPPELANRIGEWFTRKDPAGADAGFLTVPLQRP